MGTYKYEYANTQIQNKIFNHSYLSDRSSNQERPAFRLNGNCSATRVILKDKSFENDSPETIQTINSSRLKTMSSQSARDRKTASQSDNTRTFQNSPELPRTSDTVQDNTRYGCLARSITCVVRVWYWGAEIQSLSIYVYIVCIKEDDC